MPVPLFRHAESIVALACALAISLPVATMAADRIPRTASGKPDLSGTYDAATLTPLTRPAAYGDNLYLTKEEAEKIAATEAAITRRKSEIALADRGRAQRAGGAGERS
jgi:hypothetical protein